MKTVTAVQARESLDRLIEEVASGHEPVLITGAGSAAVLVGEGDWRSMRETLHLMSVPGVRESIVEGMGTPVDECSDGLDW